MRSEKKEFCKKNRRKRQWLVCFLSAYREKGKVRLVALRGKGGHATIKDASTERLPQLFNLRSSQKQGGCQLAAKD